MRVKGLVAIAATAALATSLGLGTATTAGAAEKKATPAKPATQRFQGDASKLVGIDRDSAARLPVLVQFRGQGAAASATQGSARVLDRRAGIASQARSALATARKADPRAASMFTLTNAVPAVALRLNGAGVRALAQRSDVAKIWRIYPKTIDNSNTASFVGASQVWKYAGGLGKGANIAVIDSGLDYTHADFGGKGTVKAYENTDSTSRLWFQQLSKLGKAKIAGGFDFVGNDYDADPDSDAYQPIPHPDPNPLDCGGHGTHVAGTAAGYGVTKGGDTFTGNYGKLTSDKLMKMKVGPGMAPGAKLYSYKVFGCDGSTDVVAQALDRALDPNGDGIFTDHVDIINMSLGSPYGPVDDPENMIVNELTDYGVLTVASNGNSGDLTDVGGSPGSSVSALAVASTVDAYQLLDGLMVDAPADVAGLVAGQFSVAYDWANNGPTGAPVSGAVVPLSSGNADGCAPLSSADAAAVEGKVAWLTWDSNDATRRCGSAGRSANIVAAGGIGALFTGDVSPFGAGITGSADIPVFQLTVGSTEKLEPAATAGTLEVTFDGKYAASFKDIDTSIADTPSSFTSRGNHGSFGAVKPDVAAPGDTIISAGVGTGSGGANFSGTSMASPLTAGVAALVKAEHPGWKPVRVKAAVVNNAVHDVFEGPNHTGPIHDPARVGTGRIDAKKAFKATSLAYVKAQKAVSATFGVVAAPIDGGKVKKIKYVEVKNTGKKKVSYQARYDAINDAAGVTYTVAPASFSLAPGKTRSLKVTMTVDPTELRHTLDPTMDELTLDVPRQFVSPASGRVLVKPSNRSVLRVAVYGTAKPVSTTVASATDSSIDLTGEGVAQGDDESAYISLASVMSLGATSDKLPACGSDVRYADGTCTSNRTERGGDIRAVGAGAAQGWLWFGVSTHGDWANIGNIVIPYVDYDVDGDEVPDYETYVQNYPDTDVLLAITVDLHTGDQVDLEPVNFQWGDVDTNVFDTNTVLLPVGLEYLADGSTPVTGDITYGVGTYYGYTGDDIDWVEATGSFNPVDPALEVESPLYLDEGGASIPYSNDGVEQALVFRLHGAKGARDTVLDLPVVP